MAAPAILGALGALGAISGIGGIQTGVDVSSHSMLDPIQMAWLARLLADQSKRMPGYFGTLGELGQRATSPMEGMTPAREAFYGNVELPMRQLEQSQLQSLRRDASSGRRAGELLSDRMRYENRLAINQMNEDFMNQARLMGMQGREQGLANQLNALAQMKGAFYQPLGVQMIENYYDPGMSIGSLLAAVSSGVGAITSAIGAGGAGGAAAGSQGPVKAL